MHYKILEQRFEEAEVEMDEKQKIYLALLKRHKEALAVIHDLKQDKIRLNNELSEIKQRLGMAERILLYLMDLCIWELLSRLICRHQILSVFSGT